MWKKLNIQVIKYTHNFFHTTFTTASNFTQTQSFMNFSWLQLFSAESSPTEWYYYFKSISWFVRKSSISYWEIYNYFKFQSNINFHEFFMTSAIFNWIQSRFNIYSFLSLQKSDSWTSRVFKIEFFISIKRKHLKKSPTL